MTADPDRAAAQEDPKPVPPREPEQWECCQSGCDPCVYDCYWDAYARYEDALAEWERRHAGGTEDASALGSMGC